MNEAPREPAAGTPRPRRALFVTSNFPRWVGDATTPFVLHLASDLRALGWDVHVLAPHAPGAARAEVLEGVPVQRFRYLWPERAQTVCYGGDVLERLRRRPLDYAKLPALVGCELASTHARLRSFDVVHSHWLLPQGYTAGLASRLRGVPHVATVHGGDVLGLRGRAVTAFMRAALRRADAVTANSSLTAGAVQALGCPADRIFRIPMGATPPPAADPAELASLRASLCRGARGPLVVFVGRLVEEKGPTDVLEATAMLRERLPGVAVVLVGDGPARADLQALAIRLGIADRVTFTGWQPTAGVALHLAASDCFVGPSRTAGTGWREAQGLTFAEAMLAGVPVVATRSGGIVDLVRDGDTGLLVDERTPAQIAAAIVRLDSDAELRERIVAGARTAVQREHTREASARRFDELYTLLVTGARARR